MFKYSLYTETGIKYLFGDADHLQVEAVETEGNTMQECLQNIAVYVVDWHGNSRDYAFGDLPTKVIDAIELQVYNSICQQMVQEGEVALPFSEVATNACPDDLQF